MMMMLELELELELELACLDVVTSCWYFDRLGGRTAGAGLMFKDTLHMG